MQFLHEDFLLSIVCIRILTNIKQKSFGGRMKVKIFTVLALSAALFLSACGKSDADLEKAATEKLKADNVAGVTVKVNGGVATLSGEVADVTVKTKAETSVKAVEGIKSVTNNCTTKPLPTPEPPALDDEKLAGTLRETIKKMGITTVTVTVANGELTLSGDVPKDKLAAVIGAASVNNPRKVINKLTVK